MLRTFTVIALALGVAQWLQSLPVQQRRRERGREKWKRGRKKEWGTVE
jgi:hypothetical protein